MDNKAESIKRYLDVYLKKRWSIIHCVDAESYWIIDVKNYYWIMELNKSDKCAFRLQIFTEICMLYDIKLYDIDPIVREWIKGIFGRRVTTVYWEGAGFLTAVANVIEYGGIKGKKSDY